MDWQPIETAPKDGRWILTLRAITSVGVGIPARAVPELRIVRRANSSEGGGYWESTHGYSVADHMVGSLWNDLDALPLREMYDLVEQRRLARGGAPNSLPAPL